MKDKIKYVVGAICLTVIFVSGGYLYWYYLGSGETEESEKIREETKEQVRQSEEQSKAEIPVDFEQLCQTNPDVYAWIEIPGTQISYPIVQNLTQDQYYLDHAWDGEENPGGAIFTQSVNRKDFTDFNTVIYGHVMGDGTMFNGLHEYMDKSYWEDHQEVIIYTPEHKLTYRIFASVVYDDRHIMNSFHFQDTSDRREFLESVYGSRDLRSQFDESVQVTENDRILTLSTCISSEYSHRYLVEAVLVNEE